MKKILLFLFITSLTNAQIALDDIEDSFEDFAELSREQLYAHINKSTFITGENIWFKIYAFRRDDFKFSTQTANIYCVFLDKDANIINQKMIMGLNGVANGQFEINNTLKSGEYTLKFYTNWSRNFKTEYTHYQTKIKILNPEDKKEDKPLILNDKIDVQLLPESGHLLANTLNKVGVVAKDQLGRAVKNLRITLFENDTKLTEFTLNDLGIHVFNILPKPGIKYKASYDYNNKKYEVNFPKIAERGIILNTENKQDFVTLQVRTNTKTLSQILNKPYKITIHNSVELLNYDFFFQENNLQQFKFNKSSLFPGINIFTLFNPEGKAIAERMYFNFQNLNIIKPDNKAEVSKVSDSLIIKIPIKGIDEKRLQSLSASVLPKNSKAYNHHNDIKSSFLLRPYLKGPVENLRTYFSNDTSENIKKIDQLLLTQGWSSYDWDMIFRSTPDTLFDFEYGIDYTLASNSNKNETFLVYPNINSKSEILDISPDVTEKKVGLFPLKDEKLNIGMIKNDKSIGIPKLVVNFTPKAIPNFSSNIINTSTLKANQYTNQSEENNYGLLDKEQQLEEVKISAQKKYTRIEKIQNKTLGKIYDFDEKMKIRFRTFAQFISGHGFNVQTTDEKSLPAFIITNHNSSTINGTIEPVIFLNGVYLLDYTFLREFSMRDIDYVEINKSGVGEGLRAGAGVIRIYTDPFKSKKANKNFKKVFKSYDIPLTFEKPKLYYSPIYKSKKNSFFKAYGTIDWKPNLLVKNNVVSFRIPNYNQSISILLEGVLNDDNLISEVITIDDEQMN